MFLMTISSVLNSAGAILNIPYVQYHLATFIKEKEDLQEALQAR
jgi:hypothetical protein